MRTPCGDAGKKQVLRSAQDDKSKTTRQTRGDCLMTTSNAAAADKTNEKTAGKSGPAKLSEKLAEKRRALGRGLESLLPGPRVVPAPASPTLPQGARKDGAPDVTSSQFPVLSSQRGDSSSSDV